MGRGRQFRIVKILRDHSNITYLSKIMDGWVGAKKKLGNWVFKYLMSGSWQMFTLLTRWARGVKKGQKHAYVIFEWSLRQGRLQ